MLEIKDLLFRFEKIFDSEELKIETLRKVFSDVLGLEIKAKDIKIQNHIIYLNIKPIYKNEILFKQEEIQERLKKSFSLIGKKIPEKII